MSLHSPVEYAQIVDSYIDGWRRIGWMPECRANNLPGLTQGGSQECFDLWCFSLILFIGSSGDIIVSHFAAYYHNEATQLGIDLNELYSALLTDGEINPPEWDIEGRQVNVYK